MAHTEQGYLLLADIAGYTGFLARTELDHAHEIISDLIDIISRTIKSLFKISKFEGDAVFAYAPVAVVSRPETLLEVIERTYVAFRNRLESSRRHTLCSCRACNSMASLDLKFFFHYGEYVRKRIGNTEDLVGNDVNVVHRLMKNSVTEKTGWRGYVLMTPVILTKVGMDRSAAVELSETYEHLGELTTYTVNLQDRYVELSQKRSHDLDDRAAHYRLHQAIKAPASVVWEWLNDPVKRAVSEQMDVQPVRRIGGRTREGSINHCAHGKAVIVEEIIEWKPFEYVSLRVSGGVGVMKITYELTERGNETLLVNRICFVPNLRLLRPLGGVIMGLIARSMDMKGMFERIKTMAEKDWQERSSAFTSESIPVINR
jgi:hypothetical protein